MNRVRIAVFAERAAAESVRGLLAEAGIPAEVHDELWLARLWFVSKRAAGFRLEVAAPAAEEAQKLLLILDTRQAALRWAIRCPECRSLRVDYPQFTQKSLLTNLALGLIAELGLVEKDYYCECCHCMWSVPRQASPRARSHLAPDYFLERLEERPHPEGRTMRAVTPGRRARGSKSPVTRGGVRANRPPRLWLVRPWRKVLGGVLVCAGAHLLLGSNTGLAAIAPGSIGSALVRKNPVPGQRAAATTGGGAENPETPTYLRDVLPIFMGKCARCHGDSTILHNWMDYPTAFGDRWEIKRRVWHSWKGTYYKQPMPTGNSPEAQVITEEERATIREWVESGAPRGVLPRYSGAITRPQQLEMGKRLFTTICAACHQPTGQGIPARFPPLAGSDFLNSDKHRAIKVVINGLQGEVVVNGQKFNNSMPKFPLSDQEIACALSYVYASFGNSAKEVTSEEVSAARIEKPDGGGNGSQSVTAFHDGPSPWE